MAAINGVLDEERGSCLMLLLDMSRYLVNTISQEHNFDSIHDVSDLRSTNMDITCDLTAKMWSYWHSAPKGPGVYEMLLDWIKSQPTLKRTSRNASAIANSARIPPQVCSRHFVKSHPGSSRHGHASA
mmetsp:Transcript_24436/g.60967  ORF Transcript_24436/g.60967 Transcript_24436/m.60967 type:complete len:128 (+) Transcript_24436:148-531(+)